MTENEIIVLHDCLYEYLNGLNEEDASFRFRLRGQDTERLKKGYWFMGNVSYLETSFWAFSDNKHKTPVIRLVYYFSTQKWACELVARDNEPRATYFKKINDI